MAEIALRAAAGAALSAGNPAIGLALNLASSTVGSFVDGQIFGGNDRHIEGARLSDLTVQTSSYGRVIPQIFGRTRVAGNVIWSTPIKELATTTEVSTGKGGGRSTSTTQFSYFATLAIAIAEGEVDSVLRVWADSLVLDVDNIGTSYRFYPGSETQAVDPTIEAIQGVGNAPAYRGLSYIVIEDLPLAAFGNRIPNFSFEVNRLTPLQSGGQAQTEQLITGVNLIPGSGEFVYDTEVQHRIEGVEVNGSFAPTGVRQPINQTNNSGKANSLLAIDQLEETCPNTQWIGVVVTWFGDNINAGDCRIVPGVEFKEGASTEPDLWHVGGYDRQSARQITLDEDGNPAYGGTPSDASILRLLDELRARGYKIMFYPLFFMDTPSKPWRGRVTGSEDDVNNFFIKTEGYNDYINHYINLVQGKVDAFVIGSELIGITSVTDGTGHYPAIPHLLSLAQTAKSILGAEVKITYAADWSEYHHAEGGWYNLDPLWASPDIDMVGIDAYFPLTDRPQQGYDVQELMEAWESGEGYDYIYTDEARTQQENIAPEFAWKNIRWWWENSHTNPDNNVTGWIPQSKPIWFTEYGFPSVDGAANQPNVFFDPTSSESFFPRFSTGTVDVIAQRTAITATELQWQDSDMVEQMLIWTWDARPFPYWPDLDSIWADTGLWQTGHWIQGKLGVALLSDIVRSICEKAGLSPAQIDVSRLTDIVYGYVMLEQQTARRALESLQAAYFFDVVERDGVLIFTPRNQGEIDAVISDDLLDFSRLNGGPRITRAKEVDLPQSITVSYLNPSFNYQVGSQFSQREAILSQRTVTINIPVVMYDQQAKYIADSALYRAWQERNAYEFYLPARYLTLEVGDRIRIVQENVSYEMRIEQVTLGRNWVAHIRAVADDVEVYAQNSPAAGVLSSTSPSVMIASTQAALLDIAALPGETNDTGRYYVSTLAQDEGWNGAQLFRSDDGAQSYQPITQLDVQATAGQALTVLAAGQSDVRDLEHEVEVALQHGELESINDMALLNGGNLALLGEEIIQFRDAQLLANGRYRLSHLLRGRLGTEHAVDGHNAPERFMILDSNLTVSAVPELLLYAQRAYKAVTLGQSVEEGQSLSMIYQGRRFRPYSPVHITGHRVGNDINIRWVRRTRIGGGLRDFVDVPLSEESERYEVDIVDNGQVIRTIRTTEPSVIYEESEQLLDFGQLVSELTVHVYQLSGAVGRGYAGVALLEGLG